MQPPLASQPHPVYQPPLPGQSPKRSALLWALRFASLFLVLELFLQAMLAALFVGGNVGLLSLHGINAFFITVVVFLCMVLGACYRWVARGPWWPMLLGGLLWLGLFIQEILGYTRIVPLHIFCGVLLITLCTVYCLALFRHVHAPRPRRAAAGGRA